ncbi:hypothetical protein GA0070613_6471 [Micromonospora inositola]|uniref:Endonuclease/Exonuclease/phosphatase family protein n=1 Tax=Micromonospora inositola TaxID=47865 RepID=A0A1C5K6Q1_9ACTN|nr:hypothetical protein GA0070613_6471 [Micromonospora inositola]
MAACCKSVAKATEVRILYPPPGAKTAPDQQKCGQGPILSGPTESSRCPPSLTVRGRIGGHQDAASAFVDRLIKTASDLSDPASLPQVVGGDLNFHLWVVATQRLELGPDLDGSHRFATTGKHPLDRLRPGQCSDLLPLRLDAVFAGGGAKACDQGIDPVERSQHVGSDRLEFCKHEQKVQRWYHGCQGARPVLVLVLVVVLDLWTAGRAVADGPVSRSRASIGRSRAVTVAWVGVLPCCTATRSRRTFDPHRGEPDTPRRLVPILTDQCGCAADARRPLLSPTRLDQTACCLFAASGSSPPRASAFLFGPIKYFCPLRSCYCQGSFALRLERGPQQARRTCL